jgi:hypothetical protein
VMGDTVIPPPTPTGTSSASNKTVGAD